MNNEFSWSAAREARIDRAIDRAVRDMMQVDPPAGLRRRVLARLNECGERRGHLLPQFAFAAVALVVVLLSGTEMWYRTQVPTPPQAPVMAKAPPAPVVDIEAVIRQKTFSSEVAIPGQVTRERIPIPHITSVFGNRSGAVSAATVETGRRQIVVPPLTIVPLSARPVVIEPLVLPSKGGQ